MKHETNEIERSIAHLSDQSVRRLDKQFDLSEKTKDRIYQIALRRTGIRENTGNDSSCHIKKIDSLLNSSLNSMKSK